MGKSSEETAQNVSGKSFWQKLPSDVSGFTYSTWLWGSFQGITRSNWAWNYRACVILSLVFDSKTTSWAHWIKLNVCKHLDIAFRSTRKDPTTLLKVWNATGQFIHKCSFNPYCVLKRCWLCSRRNGPERIVFVSEIKFVRQIIGYNNKVKRSVSLLCKWK